MGDPPPTSRFSRYCIHGAPWSTTHRSARVCSPPHSSTQHRPLHLSLALFPFRDHQNTHICTPEGGRETGRPRLLGRELERRCVHCFLLGEPDMMTSPFWQQTRFHDVVFIRTRYFRARFFKRCDVFASARGGNDIGKLTPGTVRQYAKEEWPRP